LDPYPISTCRCAARHEDHPFKQTESHLGSVSHLNMPVRRSTRRSARLAAKEQAKAEAAAQEPEEAPTPQKLRRSARKRRPSMKEEADAPTPNKHEEFRHALQSMLDSPDNKVKRTSVVAPSPRVDRITIQNKNNEEAMEFLIPPKRTSEPLEIRQQIRSALSFPDEPTTTGKSKLDVPMKDGNTKLWSPNVPGFHDRHDEDRISKLLILTIFGILIAVFCAYYQAEIVEALQTALSFAIEYAGKFAEWLSCSVSSVWDVISSTFSSAQPLNAADSDSENIDDSVTR